jgi:hypothetical protein
VGVNKAKGKGKGAAKKSAKKSTGKKKAKDVVQVRENINDLVTESAEDIATEVIKVAKMGQLASAKYLFEVVGLYPATEQTAAMPVEDSLAYTLLKRMGLPLEPVVTVEDLPAAVTNNAKGMSNKSFMPNCAGEDVGGRREEEQELVQVEGEE